VDAVENPNLADDAGYLIVEYDPVQEYAHRVGRALKAIVDDKLTRAVVAEVCDELNAVENAERGDLSGRAQQAVVLSRADANPVQVAAADAVLAKDPLGGSELFLGLDPTAASVVAAHWLKAAADVVSDVADMPAEQVVAAADDIEALPVATPTLVLELFEFADSARRIVVDLVSDAMLVAEGLAPRDLAMDLEDDDDDEEGEHGGDTHGRLTPLDPARPARDLLEDLLTGIRGCRLVYADYADVDSSVEDEDGQDDLDSDVDEQIDDAFCAAVRDRAIRDRERFI
jgi:hypothetical protein